MGYIEYVQQGVARKHGPGHEDVAACAAVHARTAVVTELEEDYRDRFAAYAERLRVAIELLNEEHRHSRAAGEGILDELLDALKRESGEG